jgi:alanine racemase
MDRKVKRETLRQAQGSVLNASLTWAEIDLDAIAHNARELKRHVGTKTALMAVVKANGYGHGAVPVAETALDNGANSLAVHRALEGVQLRQAGITAPC